LKLGGCLVIYLKTLLKPSPPPLDQNFALFKIQMKFGRIHQIFFFSFPFSLFSLQTRPRDTLAGYPLSLSLILFVLCTWTQKKGGSPRQSCQDHTPPLSLTPALSNPNQHQAAAQESAKTPPTSHSPPLPHPFSLSKPEVTQRMLVPTRAQEANQPLPPRHQSPLATVVDAQWPTAAHATRWPSSSPHSVPSRARSRRRERHSHSEACTPLFPAHCTSASTASKPQQRATLAQHARQPEPPGRDMKTLHAD
jgi:hypothetical protein